MRILTVWNSPLKQNDQKSLWRSGITFPFWTLHYTLVLHFVTFYLSFCVQCPRISMLVNEVSCTLNLNHLGDLGRVNLICSVQSECMDDSKRKTAIFPTCLIVYWD